MDEELRELLLKKLNTARECGLYISEARETLSKREFAEATKGISLPAVRAYVAFAKHNRHQPVTELKSGMRSMADVMLALQTGGLLPFPNTGHGEQRLLDPGNLFSAISRNLQKALVGFAKVQNAKPLSRWEPLQLETFLEELKPVVKAYLKIEKELQKRAA